MTTPHPLRGQLAATLTAQGIDPTPGLIDAILEVMKPKRKPSQVQLIAEELATVCHMIFAPNAGMLCKEAKLLLMGTPMPTPELIHRHYNGDPAAFWRRVDWRGQKGQNPTPYAIRQTWGQWSDNDNLNQAGTGQTKQTRPGLIGNTLSAEGRAWADAATKRKTP